MARYGVKKDSRLILAYDVWKPREASSKGFMQKALDTILKLEDLIAGVKIGVPTISTLGLWEVAKMLETLKGKMYLLADVKLADIGHISKTIVKLLAEAGFEGFISHTFIGFRDGLEEVVREARSKGLEVYGLIAMSHKGGEEVLNKNFNILLDLAIKSKVDGLVVPATMPRYVEEARSKAPNLTIISPGVGAQGANPGDAICRGADFEIVGRAILSSEEPRLEAEKIRRVLRWKIS